jgi:hypothetical protein
MYAYACAVCARACVCVCVFIVCVCERERERREFDRSVVCYLSSYIHYFVDFQNIASPVIVLSAYNSLELHLYLSLAPSSITALLQTPSEQVTFFKLLVLPLFSAWVKVFPECQSLLNQVWA